MFMTMVMPLFNAATMLLSYEPSETHKMSLKRLQRGSFKQFMRISKSTNSWLVEDMIRKDLEILAKEEKETAERKWKGRQTRTMIEQDIKIRHPNGLRGVPNSWSELINTQVQPCPKCHKKKGATTNRWHLKYYHKIELKHINATWREEICP